MNQPAFKAKITQVRITELLLGPCHGREKIEHRLLTKELSNHRHFTAKDVCKDKPFRAGLRALAGR
jgi:hypothetical protein